MFGTLVIVSVENSGNCLLREICDVKIQNPFGSFNLYLVALFDTSKRIGAGIGHHVVIWRTSKSGYIAAKMSCKFSVPQEKPVEFIEALLLTNFDFFFVLVFRYNSTQFWG